MVLRNNEVLVILGLSKWGFTQFITNDRCSYFNNIQCYPFSDLNIVFCFALLVYSVKPWVYNHWIHHFLIYKWTKTKVPQCFHYRWKGVSWKGACSPYHEDNIDSYIEFREWNPCFLWILGVNTLTRGLLRTLWSNYQCLG